jgi:segregation and condensation protein B
MTSKKTIKSALESMLFVWGDPLDAKVAADLFNISVKEAYDYFKELQAEYDEQDRGIMIREIDKAFQFCSRPENSEYIERLCTPVKEKRLTQSAMEVLAIIAYKQPVTKGEIESIRGIKCDRVLEGLAKKELIQETGRGTGIGRPILYGTTNAFLKLFGFVNLSDLPDIEDIGKVVREDEEEAEGISRFQQISIDFRNA